MRLPQLSGKMFALGLTVLVAGWLAWLLMSAASVAKWRTRVPVSCPEYPCSNAACMARYRRRLSLMVDSFWRGGSFQRVYHEPISELPIS